jgi:hypothetical protein
MGKQKIPSGETKRVIAETGTHTLTVTGNRVRFSGSQTSANNGREVKTQTEVQDLKVESSDNGLFAFNPGPSEATVEVADE